MGRCKKIFILVGLIAFLSQFVLVESRTIEGDTEKINKIENIDDSNMLEVFDDITNIKNIQFDLYSTRKFDKNFEASFMSRPGNIERSYDFGSLQISSRYEKIDTGFFNAKKQTIKQTYFIRNLINEAREVKVNIKHEINSSLIKWNGKEIAITNNPINLIKKKNEEGNNLPFIIYFGDNYYDFSDVSNLSYLVSVYKKENKNYIDLQITVNAGALEEIVIDPAIGWTINTISSSASGAHSAYAIDIDNDIDIDVVGASSTSNQINWYKNDGNNPPAWTAYNVSDDVITPRSVFAIDIDGDNDIDIISASEGDDKIAWYENNGTNSYWLSYTITTSADGAWSVYATDIDGDNDNDILSASVNDDKIVWYENRGGSPPNWTARTINSSADYAISVYATDIDGDNDRDVLSTSLFDDKIAWYENDGSNPPGWTAKVIANQFDPKSVFAIDINNDNDIDVVASGGSVFGFGNVEWYENDGGLPPNWTTHSIGSPGGVSSVYADDLDGDGDIDVMSTGANGGSSDIINWYENSGGSSPSWVQRNIVQADNDPISIFSEDIDGDNDRDIVVSIFSPGNIQWIENNKIAEILSILPMQVVENVDLVKHKNTLVRSKIRGFNATATVTLFFNNTEKNSTVVTFNGDETKTVDLYFSPDLSGQLGGYQIKIHTNVSGGDTINKIVLKKVVETKDLSLFFVPVNDVDFVAATNNNMNFIEKVYPIRDGGIQKFDGIKVNSNIPSSQQDETLLDLRFKILGESFLAKLFTDKKFINAVGIVPDDYLDNLGATGINFGGRGFSDVVLIEESQIKTTAHEIAHTLELCDEYNGALWTQQNNIKTCPNGDLDNNGTIDDICVTNGGCLTNTLPPLFSDYDNISENTVLRNFMGGSDSSPIESWISNNSYKPLLSRLDINSNFTLPSLQYIPFLGEYIVLKGMLTVSNSFEITPYYELENGFITNSSLFSGGYSFEVLDSSNQLISNISFNPLFSYFSENGTIVNVNKTILIFALPINENVSKVRLKNGTFLINELNKTSNTPFIQFNTSFQDFILYGLKNIAWQASDLDNDTLSYALLLNKAIGINKTLAFDLNQTNFTFNFSTVQEGKDYSITLLATDGFNTNSIESKTFCVDSSNLSICGLKLLNANQIEAIFEFNIANKANQPLNNINWTLNTGETLINSDKLFNLTSEEDIFVYVKYNYSINGNHTITAIVTVDGAFDSQSIQVTI